MICAMDKNRGIGYQGKIPWHIKEDLIRFKELTLNKTVIFGRVTYESLLGYYQRSGKPMPKRNTIVVSSKKLPKKWNVYHSFSIEEAIDLAKRIEKEEVFISGGAKVFQQGIKYAEKLYLTVVKGKFKTDTFFPDYSLFKVIKEDNKNNDKYSYKFLELIK